MKKIILIEFMNPLSLFYVKKLYENEFKNTEVNLPEVFYSNIKKQKIDSFYEKASEYQKHAMYGNVCSEIDNMAKNPMYGIELIILKEDVPHDEAEEVKIKLEKDIKEGTHPFNDMYTDYYIMVK